MARYAREGRLLWPLAMVITAGGAPGTLVGAWLRTHWLAERETFEYFVSAILLYLAWSMLADLRRKTQAAPSHEPVRLLAWDRRILRFAQGTHEYGIPLPSLLVFFFLVGVVGSAYGTGGGSFMVPLCLAFGLGGLLGAYLGARCQRRIPRGVSRGFLTLLLLGLALRYIWAREPMRVKRVLPGQPNIEETT